MIRTATVDDVTEIHAMIRELADYEQAPHEAEATAGQLRDALFGENPVVFAHIAEDDATGQVVGFALWFLSFSTWRGRHGVYLEDLYIRPHARRSGYGKALLRELAAICTRRGYGRLEWSVLDWNQPAIDFYKSLGAVPMDEWTVFRLTGQPLTELSGPDRG